MRCWEGTPSSARTRCTPWTCPGAGAAPWDREAREGGKGGEGWEVGEGGNGAESWEGWGGWRGWGGWWELPEHVGLFPI